MRICGLLALLAACAGPEAGAPASLVPTSYRVEAAAAPSAPADAALLAERVGALVAELAGPDAARRGAALEALLVLGPEAVPLLAPHRDGPAGFHVRLALDRLAERAARQAEEQARARRAEAEAAEERRADLARQLARRHWNERDVDAFFTAQQLQAELWALEGDLPRAQALLDALATLGRDRADPEARARLRRAARAAETRTRLLAPAWAEAPDPAPWEDPLPIALCLTNVSEGPLDLSFSDPAATADDAGGDSLGFLDLDVRVRDAFGGVSDVRVRRPVRLAGQFRLAPGETLRVAWALPLAALGSPDGALFELTLGGTLKPRRLSGAAGEAAFPVLTLPAARRRWYDPRCAAAADQPLASVRAGLEQRDFPLVYVASHLLPSTARPVAAADLVAALDAGSPAMRRCAAACLGVVTEVTAGYDADGWRAWWRRDGARWAAALRAPPPVAADGGPLLPTADATERGQP